MTKEKSFEMRWGYLWAIRDFNVKSKHIGYNDKIWNQLYTWAGEND